MNRLVELERGVGIVTNFGAGASAERLRVREVIVRRRGWGWIRQQSSHRGGGDPHDAGEKRSNGTILGERRLRKRLKRGRSEKYAGQSK
jgi:hypothetical protein